MKKLTLTTFSLLFLSGLAISQTSQNTPTSSDSSATSPKKNMPIKKGLTIDRSTMKTVTIAPSSITAPVVKEEEVTPTTPVTTQPKKK